MRKLRGIGKNVLIGFAVGSVVSTGIKAYNDEYNSPKTKKRIVVVGAGYAGRTFVKNINTRLFDVVLIDRHLFDHEQPQSRFGVRQLIFQPQPNYVDSISERKIVQQNMPISSKIRLIEGECVDIDTTNSQVKLKSSVESPNPEPLEYDYLVFATGSIPDTYSVKMDYDCQNNMWYFFKNKHDLQTLMTAFDIIGLDNVVIMGGGITGVELASELSKRITETKNAAAAAASTTTGTATKPSDIAKGSAPAAKKPNTITILEAGDRLLPKLKESTSIIITKHLVEKQNVKIITSANITEIKGGKIKLLQNGVETTLSTVIAVWTCGVKPDELVFKVLGNNTVLNQLQLTPNKGGLPLLGNGKASDPAVPNASNIFAIGDCNNLLPKSAQNSKQQGKYLAQYFNDGLKPDAKEFKFESQGSMIRLSDRVFMDSPVYTGMLPLWVHRVIIWLDI